MTPTLSVLSGPLAGTVLPLDTEVLTIGRHSSNDLQISELAVSRHHCVLTRSGPGLTIRDLDSLHGTFVNGLPVQEKTLEDGDVIVLGESSFTIVLKPSTEMPPAPKMENTITGETTVVLALDDSLFLHPARLRRALDTDSTAQALGSLLAFSGALSTLTSVEALGRTLVERVLEMAPADRAFFLLTGEPADPPEVVASHRCSPAESPGAGPKTNAKAESMTDTETGPGLSRTVLSRVCEERVALLATEVDTDGAVAQAESVQASGVRSLLCVPLLQPALAQGERVFGVLYLEAWSPHRRFTQHHLELVTAVGRLASQALVSARRQERLEAENRRLSQASLGHGLIGESPAMQQVSRLIQRVAPTDSTVLLRGESGTGKEVAARAIHRASRRHGRPFVAINCASLSEQLLESELFGHERGAFTGAVARKIGKLEVADGGTVFLDELGELPQGQQARLLRVLEQRTFERVGGTRPIRVDIRLVAATNRNLEQAVKEGTFREDLFYRLNVITLVMPALRNRREDISLLAHHFTHQTAERLGRRTAGLSSQALRCLLEYDWPGNVRELANAIERALVLGSDDLIHPEDLPETLHEKAPPVATGATSLSYHQALNQEKSRLIKTAVQAAAGNVTRAAKALQLHPNHLHRLISNLGLRDSLKPSPERL